MNKNDLIGLVAEKAGATKKMTAEIFDATIEAIAESLMDNKKIRISGFGVFELKHREERNGVNPRTHEPMKIEAADIPSVKLSQVFKERFN